MMIVSGVYGPATWQATFAQRFPSLFAGTLLARVPIIHASVFVFFTVFLLFYAPACILAVRRVRRQRGQPLGPALSQLIPMLLVSVAAGAWLWSPFSSLRGGNFALFVLALGLGFGKMATKIIYAHLTKRHFPYHSGLLLPLFLGALLVNMPLLNPNWAILRGQREALFLWTWFVVAAVGYLNWSYHVINSFCSYLGIACFSLPQRPPLKRA